MLVTIDVVLSQNTNWWCYLTRTAKLGGLRGSLKWWSLAPSKSQHTDSYTIKNKFSVMENLHKFLFQI